MNPRLRQTLVTTACAALAVWLGWKIAEGEYFWPGVAAAIAASAVCVRLFRLPLDVILCGGVLIGYIVGNRGFAQLMPAQGLPLLPAELALLVAGGWRFVASAFERRLPFQRDALDWAVLAWLVVGGARLVFDAPRFGFVALRDFAMVYYAVFFFLVQEMARDARARRFLAGCLVTGCVLLVPMYALYSVFPDVFLRHLLVHGLPVIFYKGDLLNTFFALGSLLVFFNARGRWQPLGWMLAAGMFVYVAGGENRASLFGLGLACLLLLAAGRWRYPALQVVVAAAALFVTITLATAGNTWAERKLAGVTDRARSLVDLAGEGVYRSEEAFNKGANNRFRLVWWRNVVEETWAGNPVFGLGFGADLAGGFLQEYYPDSDEEFSARSPHNFFLSVFARLGAVGLLVWLALCVVLLTRTWRALHRDEPADWPLWCMQWVILGSATFGVVLESPMGAVPFWIAAGLANARVGAASTVEEEATLDGTGIQENRARPLEVPS